MPQIARTGRRRFASTLLAALMGGAAPGLAQDGARITGRVTSADTRTPLSEANVYITELSVSVRVNAEGVYTIALPAERVRGQSVTLRARAIGYASQATPIVVMGGAHVHDFALRQDINRLDAVVVTGTVTGTAQKKLPFSMTRVDASDIPVPATNTLASLQGKVPGAHIVMPGGRPGQEPAILLRGPKSLNATGREQGPLIIVDGVIINGGTQDLDPSNIESVEIIKGAAASTLYGSRAGAGVIQIRTKLPSRTQVPRITFRSEYGFNDVQGQYLFARRHSLMMDEKYEKVCIRESAAVPLCSRVIDIDTELRRINDTTSAGALNPHALERDINIFTGPKSRQELKGLFQANHWPMLYNPIHQVLTPGQFVNSTVDLSARTGGTAIYTSLSGLSQEGAFQYLKGYRRQSARVNVQQWVNDQLSFQVGSMFSRSTQYPAGTNQANAPGATNPGSFFRLTRVAPMTSLRQRDRFGRLYVRTNLRSHGQQDENPLYSYENTEGELGVDRFIASLATQYQPAGWLGFDATFSADRRRTSDLFFRDRGYRTTSLDQAFGGLNGRIATSTFADLGYNVLLGSRASFGLGTSTRVTVSNRYSYESEDLESSSVSGSNFAVPGLVSVSNAAASTIIATSTQAEIRAIGAITGAQVEFRDRYILDALLRYDGSSLFGARQRWHPYFRTSFAWRASEESFWTFPGLFNDFKLRASVGTAGGRPNVDAQYETLQLIGGMPSAITLGNSELKPERTLETEFGVDAEMWTRVGLSATFARAITTDQLLLLPAPVASGYPSQWNNAGTLDGQSWELSLRLPLARGPSLVWNSVLNFDRTRTYITRFDLPSQVVQASGTNTGSGVRLWYAPGARFGTIVGRRYARSCAELPPPFDAQCGPGMEWQANDEGYIVWVGANRSWRDGVMLNLWQAVRPGCLKGGQALDVTGIPACVAAGGAVNSPWGLPDTHWGMPTMVRDSNANALEVPLGNTLPDFRVTMSHDLRAGRVTFFGLVDVSVGNDIFNEERHWSYGDFMYRDQDQDGKSVETAKPIGYYWRAGRPVGAGAGGFYDTFVVGSNRTVEDGSYAKLRELSVGYDLAGVRRLCDCAVSLVARNLYTWTRFTGWDPELGVAGGQFNSAAVAAGANFQYPQMRTFTFAVTTRF